MIALLNKTRNRLQQRTGTYTELTRSNPVLRYSWLTKFARGEITNPTVNSLHALIVALDQLDKDGATHARRVRKKRKTHPVRKRP